LGSLSDFIDVSGIQEDTHPISSNISYVDYFVYRKPG
jgi:hypothetical protein